MTITANHAHLMPPRRAADRWPEGDSQTLLRHLDACGIDRAVIFPPFAAWQFGGDRRAANLWALDQARRHADRFIPAATIFPPAADAIELLRLLHAEGVRLAKVHPSIEQYDVSDPAAADCYAAAAELGIALDFHTGAHGTRLAHAEPVKFDSMAWDHPQLKLVFEHLGGRAYFEIFLAILGNHAAGRVYGGVTSILADENNRLWYLGPEKLADAIACAGAGKLIFGLDFPYNSPQTTRKEIETIMGLDIAPQDKEAILGGNLRGLLGV